jgi:hypothetical protein
MLLNAYLMPSRSKMFAQASVRFILLIMLASGCSSTSDVDPRASFIDRYCVLQAPCCERSRRSPPGDECRERFADLLERRAFDPVAGEACLRELAATNHAADSCEHPHAAAPSCNDAFRAVRKLGEDCRKDGDCAPSPGGVVFCPTSGRCTLLARAGEGDACCATVHDPGKVPGAFSGCGNPTSGGYCEYAEGLSCWYDACARRAAVGEKCRYFEGDCTIGAYCDVTACVPRLAEGSSCDNRVDSDNFGLTRACIEGTICDASTNKCMPHRPEGATCSASSECASKACVGNRCGRVGVEFELFGLDACGLIF